MDHGSPRPGRAAALLAFDEVAELVTSLSAGMKVATQEQLKQLIEIVVESVSTADRRVTNIRLKPAVLPFFTDACLSKAPPEGFEPPTPALGRRRSIH